MDKVTLERRLERLQTGEHPVNTPLVERYLNDPHAADVAHHFLQRGRSQSQRPLLPPSHCLLILD